MAHYCIVQDHSGAILQVLQCIGQSGTGDGSLPAGEVVSTFVHVDMACDVGCPTTPQTDQLQQQQDKYLQIPEGETGGRERENKHKSIDFWCLCSQCSHSDSITKLQRFMCTYLGEPDIAIMHTESSNNKIIMHTESNPSLVPSPTSAFHFLRAGGVGLANFTRILDFCMGKSHETFQSFCVQISLFGQWYRALW